MSVRGSLDLLRRVAEAAPQEGVGTLTLYAFSSDNWRRPAAEVAGLMAMLRLDPRREVSRLTRDGIRVTAIGHRDRLPGGLAREIARAEVETRSGERLHLRLAIDDSGRDAIVAAARSAAEDGELTREAVARRLADGVPAPDADLVIRTSGEQRLSDFLVWESAYAELLFTPCLWPDFGAGQLAEAITSFRDANAASAALRVRRECRQTSGHPEWRPMLDVGSNQIEKRWQTERRARFERPKRRPCCSDECPDRPAAENAISRAQLSSSPRSFSASSRKASGTDRLRSAARDA